MKKLISLLLTAGLVFATERSQGQTYTFTAIAGGKQGSNDGVGTNAQFFTPEAAAVDGAGNIYVADGINNAIRKIRPFGTNWIVTTIAGGTRGAADGTNTTAQFSGPTGIMVDNATNLYVADQFNYTIRKVAPQGTNWVVTTIAGQMGTFGSQDGTGTNAQFHNPTGMAIDGATNIFIADEFNNAIRELSPSGTNWAVATIAGGTSGSADGTNLSAQFFSPAGVAVDTNGRIFVADQFNNSIRLITPSGTNWVTTTIAGQLNAGASNGAGTNAQFTAPIGVAVDTNENVFVSDLFNNAVRKLTNSGGIWTVSTIGGGGGSGFHDGTGTNAKFFLANGITADPFGNLVVSDSGNNAIRHGAASDAAPATGDLEVDLTSSNAVTAGAQWQVDGGTFQTNGAVVTGLTPGSHIVSFANISGYTTPAYQFVTITAHLTTVAQGDYPVAVPNAGSLEVLISPDAVVSAGAQWQVDGGTWQTNGAIVAGLSIGSHPLAFSAVAGWETPEAQTVLITNSQTTLGLGTYVPQIVPPANFNLTVNAAAGGTVTGGGTFLAGTMHNITAIPNTGFEFLGWTHDETGTNNPLAVTMTTNITTTAYFAAIGSVTLIVITDSSGAVTPNWNGKTLVAGHSYPLHAVAKPGNVFSNWTGTITTNRNPLGLKLTGSMVLEANFINNPFPAVKGIYNGLFSTTNGVTEQTAGMLRNLNLNQNGHYSGSLLVNGAAHPVSGLFTLAGQATNKIARSAAQGGSLQIALNLHWNQFPQQLSGTVSGTNNGVPWVGNLLADIATNTILSGEFTLLLPPDTNNAPPANSPGGDGYAVITNFSGSPKNPAGAIARISGALADGTAFSQSVPVSQDGYAPLFANLYGNKGLLMGWINLQLTNNSNVSVAWVHPARTTGLYQSAFTNLLLTNQVLLSRWSNAPAVLVLLTNLVAGPVAGAINASVVMPIVVTSAGKVTGANVNGTVNLKTGLLKVTIGTGASKTNGTGVILLNAANGGGFFLTKTNAQALQVNP